MPAFTLPARASKAERRLGFDTWSAVTPEAAASFRNSGHHFAVRYVRRSEGISSATNGGSMTREEAAGILAAGLALMPVQFAKKNLEPTASLGARVGAAAASNCRALGFPDGVTAWCDIEAIHPDATTADVVAYSNAWHAACSRGGYEPGIYVGPNSKLPTAVLYQDLRFTRYWKSASRVGNVDTRGYCMLQSLSDTIHGLRVDVNIITIDSRGGQPVWAAPA